MEPPPDEPPRVYPPLSRWRRKLAELHFRGGLVHAVVSRKFKTLYRGRHGQDLIQVAAVALCEAAQRYDPTYRTRDGKRVKFVTYAWRCVFGQVAPTSPGG